MANRKFSKVQAELIHKWQTVHFEQEKAADLYAKADCLRTNLGHLEFAYATGSTSQAAIHPFSDLLQKYTSIIDTQDPAQGVNNYAEGALKLAESNKSEALEWKSQLNIHKVCDEDYVQRFLASVKVNEPSEVNVLPTLAQALSQRTQPTVRLKAVNQHPKLPAFEKSNLESRTANTHQKQNSWSLPLQPSREITPVTPLSSHTFFNTVGPKKAVQLVDANVEESSTLFCTAKEQLIRENHKKNNSASSFTPTTSSYGSVKKSLGARRGPSSKFVPPLLGRTNESHSSSHSGGCETDSSRVNSSEAYDIQDENLKNIEPRMVELILNEILDQGPPVSWDDIAGLEFAKTTIQEIVVWPMLRPDIFTGLRGPPKGILLFGPPGTGKTLIGKCIASQSRATFFSISASSLTSKWIGEGEKMVRALFAVARSRQPAVVFIDEIDSLLTQRSESEHESSRRMKTEFLVQLDGATTRMDERILVVGATNRPQELDEAARRRLVKRLYIPLPDFPARCQIVSCLLEQQHSLTEDQLQEICSKTEGYSGADVANLCREAALGPIRCLSAEEMQRITPDQVRPIHYRDCLDALSKVKASVCEQDLAAYIDWNAKFGCGSAR